MAYFMHLHKTHKEEVDEVLKMDPLLEKEILFESRQFYKAAEKAEELSRKETIVPVNEAAPLMSTPHHDVANKVASIWSTKAVFCPPSLKKSVQCIVSPTHTVLRRLDLNR